MGTVPGLLDIHRAELWASGTGSFAVVATLLLNSAMRLYLYTHEDHHEKRPLYKMAYNVTVFCALVSILAGMFTTITFVFVKLYGMTCLGTGKDAQFLAFMDLTHVQRVLGFRAFFLSHYSFLVAVAAHLLMTLKGKRGAAACVMVFVGNCIMEGQWMKIREAAASVINLA